MTTSNNTGWKIHVKKILGFLLIYFAFPVASSLVVWWVTTDIAYTEGYNDGIANGKKSAFENFSEETIELVLARNLKIDKALEKRNEEIEENFEKLEKKFHAEQEKRESKFKNGLEDLVSERYNSELLKAQESGFQTGQTTGYSSGTIAGKKECQTTCERNLEEFKSQGRLWAQFVRNVKIFEEINPITETALRSHARAIISVALEGRKAAFGMAAQLNGEVDKIKNALENGDLKLVRELVRALSSTLDSKNESWQRHYQTVVSFEVN